MDRSLESAAKMILSPSAQVDEYHPPASVSIPPTKVIQVTWIHPLPSTLEDGEWFVFWEGMDGGPNLDEGYESLLGGNEDQSINLDESPKKDAVNEQESVQAAPEALDGSFFEKIFQERSVVQTPTKILPPPTSKSPDSQSPSSLKISVSFLLSHSTKVPNTITIRFAPIWASPIAPSPNITIPVVPVSTTSNCGELHKSWAKSRLVDLNELQELADEMVRTGQRGVGVGTLKVGVDGGGHDEERLRWEAEMVGRERNWVLKTFLGKVISGQSLDGENSNTTRGDDEEDLTEQKEIEEGLEMLAKLAQGLKINDKSATLPTIAAISTETTTSLKSSCPAPQPKSEDDEEDDLFALPLSPRSPEMTVSPFSFRGSAIGNLDAMMSTTLATRVPSTIVTTLSKDAIPIEGGTPLTPTLKGTPNPGEMRKKRLAGPGVSG